MADVSSSIASASSFSSSLRSFFISPFTPVFARVFKTWRPDSVANYTDGVLLPDLPPCIICLESVPHTVGVFQPPCCSHLLCIPCFHKYVESELRTKRISILCAERTCQESLTLEMCEPSLTMALIEAWGVLIAEDHIPEGQRLYCPFQDCSALLMNDTNDVEVMQTSAECPSCHRLFCMRCLVPWHADLSCSKYQRRKCNPEDTLLQGLAKDNQWRRCVKCKHLIERNEGCNHMTCRCGNEFCYLCGEQWTSYAHKCPTGIEKAFQYLFGGWS